MELGSQLIGGHLLHLVLHLMRERTPSTTKAYSTTTTKRSLYLPRIAMCISLEHGTCPWPSVPFVSIGRYGSLGAQLYREKRPLLQIIANSLTSSMAALGIPTLELWMFPDFTCCVFDTLRWSLIIPHLTMISYIHTHTHIYIHIYTIIYTYRYLDALQRHSDATGMMGRSRRSVSQPRSWTRFTIKVPGALHHLHESKWVSILSLENSAKHPGYPCLIRWGLGITKKSLA